MTAAEPPARSPGAPAPGGSVYFGQPHRPAILTLVRPIVDHPPLHQVLAGAGYHVWRAATPAEAMAAGLREQNIGILICDLALTAGSGVAFLNALRAKLPATRVLLAIFMAEAASINDVVMTLRSGAMDFLGRRLPPEHVLEAVRRVEVVAQQRRIARATAVDASRLADAAVSLAQRLSAEQQTERDPASLSGPGRFEEKLPLEIGAASVHSSTLLARRQSQLAAALRAQVIRQRAFGELANDNAAWAMLLDLYDKMLRNQPVFVSSLCLSSGAPVSTAMRRLDELVESGLIHRKKDAVDARRILVTLSDDARERVNTYLDATA